MISHSILKLPVKITPRYLNGYHLLEVVSDQLTFSREETATIVDWIRSGGALLVVIDEERRTPLLEDGVNQLLAPFGMRFTADTDYLHNCGAIARPGEIHRQTLEIPYSGGRAVEGGTPFAWRLDAEGNEAEVFAAHHETAEGGRLVALAELMAYGGMGTPHGERLTGVPRDPSRTTYWGKDAKTFMRDIRSWLLRSA